MRSCISNTKLLCGLIDFCCWILFYGFLDFNTRESELMEPVHVINIDIPDNHEEATIGAFIVCELAKQVFIFLFFNGPLAS